MPSFDHLHLTPPIAAALDRLGWTPDDPAVRESAPTAARGHNLVVVAPPAPAYATPGLAGMLSRLGPGTRGLLLCAEAQLAEWGALVAGIAGEGLRIQVARGTARAMRRLKAAEVDLVVTSPETALALLRRSALGADAIGAVALAWPESWQEAESLSPLMQDLDKDTQRIICTAAPDRVADLVERYARRALTVGAPAAESAPPAAAGPVRTVGVSWERRAASLSDLVEVLDPASVAVWTVDRSRHEDIARALPPGDPAVRVVTGDPPRSAVVVAFDLPTADRLPRLLAAGEVVLLVPPGTESYVERIAAPRRPLRLPGAADEATSEAAARRGTIARTLEERRPQAAMLTLAPLFERYDPAAVAAALYDLWTSSATAAPAAAPATAPGTEPATVKIYVGVGKKDGATVNDLVAVLTKEVRVERGKIGRVELRDAYALVELPAQDAESIARALSGTTIRRKRITARVDRGPAKPARSPRPQQRRA
ncbi:MAG TPA: DbpA RNA binding domain-containing protein [Gemmatimonadales bacterium]|nr:DbpA RNA binding domain-containing protein [Gemmatimonadales bacterium]